MYGIICPTRPKKHLVEYRLISFLSEHWIMRRKTAFAHWKTITMWLLLFLFHFSLDAGNQSLVTINQLYRYQQYPPQYMAFLFT